MNSRQRVTEVINHGKPDRIPVFGWVGGNEEFAPKVVEAFGSIDAFAEKYEFDVVSRAPNLQPFRWDLLHDLKMSKPDSKITPDEILDVPLTDPDDAAAYVGFIEQMKRVKEKELFSYTHTWGYFEGYTSIFGIENHLMNILLYKDEMKEIHKRLSEWHIKFANNILDCGVDMVHFSDDWGAQRGLLFSPDLWREIIYPYYAEVIPHIKKRKGFVSLHSDGNVASVLGDISALGFDVVHPFQESAGMSFDLFKSKYIKNFSVMGGLDVQNTIGFGNYDLLKSEIIRVLSMFKDGGLIFCTSHAVQPHCTIDELVFAYNLVYETVRTI